MRCQDLQCHLQRFHLLFVCGNDYCKQGNRESEISFVVLEAGHPPTPRIGHEVVGIPHAPDHIDHGPANAQRESNRHYVQQHCIAAEDQLGPSRLAIVFTLLFPPIRLNNERQNEQNGDGANAECRYASGGPSVEAHGERAAARKGSVVCRGWIYYIQKESEGLKKNNGGGEKREGVTIIIIPNARPGKGEGSKIKAALRFKAGIKVRLVCGVAALAERASISGFLLDHPPSFCT